MKDFVSGVAAGAPATRHAISKLDGNTYETVQIIILQTEIMYFDVYTWVYVKLFKFLKRKKGVNLKD